MNCNFCKEILSWEEYQKQDPFDREDSLIEENDKYFIFAANDDWYYNHIVVKDVKYCPVCGRKL